jgi:argininosuccinate lyase
LNGLDEIKRLIEDGKFEWRKDRQDVHMNIEAVLIEMVGEPAKKLHTARRRNDQVATDLRLWCRDAIGKILIHLRNLQVRFSGSCHVTYCYGKLAPVIISTVALLKGL